MEILRVFGLFPIPTAIGVYFADRPHRGRNQNRAGLRLSQSLYQISVLNQGSREKAKGKELPELMDFRAWECYNACVDAHARRGMRCVKGDFE
jgi:hypothetical protein